MRVRNSVRAAIGLAFVLMPQAISAQATFPARPITIVVPTAAGSTADGAARIVANELSLIAKQPVVVDNRPGAGGALAAGYAAKAAPDGYTILLGTNSTHAANVSVFKNLQYDPIKDFAPITLAESAPAFLVVTPDSPLKSVDDLRRLARAKQGDISIGVFSVSGVVAATMMKGKGDFDFVHIPYKAPSPAITDLLGGRLDALVSDVQNTVSLEQSRKVRILAATSRARFPLLPDVPTMIEAGIPDYEMVSWGAYFAPRGTSADVVATLNRLLHAAYATESVRATCARFGMQIRVSTPAELAEFVRSEIPKWSEMIRASGYEPQ
jgi:tripartite-type tricarboxylate transporter receptor subunit TctC